LLPNPFSRLPAGNFYTKFGFLPFGGFTNFTEMQPRIAQTEEPFQNRKDSNVHRKMLLFRKSKISTHGRKTAIVRKNKS
jgi:hypothetical protein